MSGPGLLRRAGALLWPQSLSGRIVAIIVAGVLVAQVLTGTIWYDMRHRQLAEVPTRVVAARLADTLRQLEPLPPALRAAELRTIVTDDFQAVLLPAPPVPAPSTAPSAVRREQPLVAAVVAARLDWPAPVIVQRAELLDDAQQPAHTWGLLTSRHPTVRYCIFAQLGDGQWLRFDAVEGQNGYDPRPLATLADYVLRIYALRILAVVAVSLVCVRLAMQPLERLVQAAQRLGSDIHSPPLPVAGPREVRKAAEAFNAMQHRIVEGVGERTRFLAAVSHDLRSPITRLRLRTELLPEGPVQDKFRQDLAEMEAMVGATLDFIRGDTADAAPRQNVDIDALLESLRQDIGETGGAVTVAGHAGAPYPGYAHNLQRALRNLLENAVRHGGGAAEVQVRDGGDGGWLEITVADRGPGIAADRLERVFEPFYRVDESRSGPAGFGLGLSIARTIAQAHGGGITLANRPGGGLVAVLRLPRAAAAR